MTINELKKSFSDGSISKPEFIAMAYEEFHNILFEYASQLNDVDIKEILIDGSGVIFTTRKTGTKIRCQPGDHRSPPIETFNFSDFEPAESEMMEKLFDEHQVFYDIGANIGWHSLNMSAKHRKAKFYCFEPIPKTYQQLIDNIKLNNAKNINCYNTALSDQPGNQKFFYYTACSGNASAANLSERSDVSEIVCPQTTLDMFVADNSTPPPDFIKCDVEGAELMVIKGGVDTIAKHQPILMVEILRKWSSKFSYNPNEIFQLLYSFGYCAFTTDGRGLFEFSEMDESTIETNFFFLHSTKHKRLITKFSH